MPKLAVREATLADAAELARLEAVSFSSDRISKVSFRRLIRAESASVRVARKAGTVVGYALLLFRRGARVSRLYSIAIDPAARGKGFAEVLMVDAARIARGRHCDRLRLEVREDNRRAIRLYRRLGYRPIGRYRNYYSDGMDALRFERRLTAGRTEDVGGSDEDRSPRDSAFHFPYIDSPVRPVRAAGAASPADANADRVHPLH